MAPWTGPTTPPHHSFFEDDYRNSLLPELQAITRGAIAHGSVGTQIGAVPRVSQLDAGRLDSELSSMIQEQLAKAFSFFRPGLLSGFQPEITLLIDLLIFGGSVLSGRPTPGSALMNLRYSNQRGLTGSHLEAAQSRTAADALTGTTTADASVGGSARSGVDSPPLSTLQRGGFGLLILCQYLWSRCSSVLASYRWAAAHERRDGGRWLEQLQDGMHRVEAVFGAASLANSLVFLNRGVYSTLRDRVLGARLVLERASVARALSFEYLNRQLVWTEISELLLFILPLISVTPMRSLLSKLPRFAAVVSPPAAASTAGGSDGGSLAPCGICDTAAPLRPFVAQPCGHVFCYYCLAARTQADARYACVRCGERVAGLKDAQPATLPVAEPRTRRM